MKPIVYVCLSIVLYSAMNLVFEQKLNKLHQAAIIACVCPVIFVVAVSWIAVTKASGAEVVGPSKAVLPILAVTALMWFFADFCFVGAYTSGGNMMTVTTIFLMFPAVGALMKYAWTRELPTGYHVAGWIVAVIAILLVTRGEVVSKASL